MSETKYICPFCDSRMESEMYRNPIRIEIFCDNCGKFISDCNIASKVVEECDKSCEVKLIRKEKDDRECANCGRFQNAYYGCGRYVDECVQDVDAYSNWIPKE